MYIACFSEILYIASMVNDQTKFYGTVINFSNFSQSTAGKRCRSRNIPLDFSISLISLTWEFCMSSLSLRRLRLTNEKPGIIFFFNLLDNLVDRALAAVKQIEQLILFIGESSRTNKCGVIFSRKVYQLPESTRVLIKWMAEFRRQEFTSS